MRLLGIVNPHAAGGRTVSVAADGNQDLHADGERVGSTPASVTLADQQLRVLVPPSLTNAEEAE